MAITVKKYSALVAMSSNLNHNNRKALNALIYFAQGIKNPYKEEDFEEDENVQKIVQLPIYSVSLLDLKKIFKVDRFEDEVFLKALDKLLNTSVQINILDKVHGVDKEIKFNLISRFEFDKNTRKLQFAFSPDLQKAIKDPKIYALIDLTIIRGLKSAYSIALYEFVLDYEKSPQPKKITIDELRKILGIGDKYPKFANLKTYALAPAIKEIKEKANIDIVYEVETKPCIRGGAPVPKKITFRIKKEQNKNPLVAKSTTNKIKLPQPEFIEILREKYRGTIPYKKHDGTRKLIKVYEKEDGSRYVYDIETSRDLSPSEAKNFYKFVYENSNLYKTILRKIKNGLLHEDVLEWSVVVEFLFTKLKVQIGGSVCYLKTEFIDNGQDKPTKFNLHFFKDEDLTKFVGKACYKGSSDPIEFEDYFEAKKTFENYQKDDYKDIDCEEEISPADMLDSLF